MKKVLLLLLFIIVILSVMCGTTQKSEPENKKKTLENLGLQYIEEGSTITEIQVSNQEQLVYSITIGEVKQWLDENWDLFEKIPEVGGREVNPEHVNFFDRSAAISPHGHKLVFSIHDYATLSATSFVLLVDLKDGNLDVVKAPIRGIINQFIWSEDSKYVAYILQTARSRGDLLAIDDVVNFERIAFFQGDDVLKILNLQDRFQANQFIPDFQNLVFKKNAFYFKSAHPKKDQINWKFDLITKEFKVID